MVEPYACNLAERVTQGSAMCNARRIAELRRDVGSLIHSGRCEQAVKTARETGDDGFADRVREYCIDRAR